MTSQKMPECRTQLKNTLRGAHTPWQEQWAASLTNGDPCSQGYGKTEGRILGRGIAWKGSKWHRNHLHLEGANPGDVQGWYDKGRHRQKTGISKADGDR